MRSSNLLFLYILFLTIALFRPGDCYFVGVGVADITGPSADVNLMGYAMPLQTARGIHTRLFSRAFVFAEQLNGSRAVFVNLDACMASQLLTMTILEDLKALYGELYSRNNVFISGIHTHAGPAGFLQYLLYDFTSLGFVSETFEAMRAGIVESVRLAHESVRPARLRVNRGDLRGASVNRSPSAYAANPPQERNRYTSDVDTEMLLLKVTDEPEAEDAPEEGLAALSWFAVHCTSMNNTNRLLSGDNKGFAEQALEQWARRQASGATTTSPLSPSPSPQRGSGAVSRFSPRFVASFAQAAVGDTSPNTQGAFCLDTGLPCEPLTSTCRGRNELCHGRGPRWPDDTASTADIGGRQAAFAKKLYEEAEEIVHGPVATRHAFVDMGNLTVTASNWTRAGRTCPAAMGFSFAAGTTDGPGAFNFKQGDTKGPALWRFIRRFIKQPGPVQRRCHAPKPILLDTGEIKFPYPWQPRVTEVGLLRVGQLLLACLPGEPTTMAGRRIKQALFDHVSPAWGPDVRVAIGGLTNTYASYITTFEEYQIQRYEGASTIFGPYTLDAYIQELLKLADSMLDDNNNEGRAVTSTSLPTSSITGTSSVSSSTQRRQQRELPSSSAGTVQTGQSPVSRRSGPRTDGGTDDSNRSAATSIAAAEMSAETTSMESDTDKPLSGGEGGRAEAAGQRRRRQRPKQLGDGEGESEGGDAVEMKRKRRRERRESRDRKDRTGNKNKNKNKDASEGSTNKTRDLLEDPSEEPVPPNLRRRQISLFTPVVVDEVPPFRCFGAVLLNAAGPYHVGQTVQVVFRAANPRNALRHRRGGTFLTVERWMGPPGNATTANVQAESRESRGGKPNDAVEELNGAVSSPRVFTAAVAPSHSSHASHAFAASTASRTTSSSSSLDSASDAGRRRLYALEKNKMERANRKAAVHRMAALAAGMGVLYGGHEGNTSYWRNVIAAVESRNATVLYSGLDVDLVMYNGSDENDGDLSMLYGNNSSPILAENESENEDRESTGATTSQRDKYDTPLHTTNEVDGVTVDSVYGYERCAVHNVKHPYFKRRASLHRSTLGFESETRSVGSTSRLSVAQEQSSLLKQVNAVTAAPSSTGLGGRVTALASLSGRAQASNGNLRGSGCVAGSACGAATSSGGGVNHAGDDMDQWEIVLTDNDWSTRLHWWRSFPISPMSYVTISWDTGYDILRVFADPADGRNGSTAGSAIPDPGVYRICYFGDAKSLFGSILPFHGCSSPFELLPTA